MSGVRWWSRKNGGMYWAPKIDWVERYPITISSRLSSTTAPISRSSAKYTKVEKEIESWSLTQNHVRQKRKQQCLEPNTPHLHRSSLPDIRKLMHQVAYICNLCLFTAWHWK